MGTQAPSDGRQSNEMRARKTVNNASGSRKVLVEEGDQLSIIIDEPKSSVGNEWVEEKLQSLEKMKEEIHKDKAKRYPKPRIQRIPAILRGRENTEKNYTPRAISIGPLHHGDPRLTETEDLKLQLTMLFIMKQNIQKEDLYKKIESNINYLRSRYIEEDIKSYNNQELSWIFLVDGCSILNYIDSCIKYNKLDAWKHREDNLLFFYLDIFLLENQLPFELLQLIMDSCPDEKGESLMKSIYLYIYKIALATRNLIDDAIIFQHATTAYEKDKKSTPPIHLLDLFRNRVLYDLSLTESDQEMKETAPKSVELNKWPSFRSASELIDVGITIKPSKTSSIKDICFTREMFSGILYLPKLAVDQATTAQFMNMVAYETCPDFYNDFQVTSYLSFMDTLIEVPNDVKVLRDAGVLFIYLGIEEVVAGYFKSFRASGMMACNSIYFKVQYDIERYYDRRVQIASWMRISQGINDYFGTPWKAMASIAIVLQLAMSLIQTLYAVKEK